MIRALGALAFASATLAAAPGSQSSAPPASTSSASPSAPASTAPAPAPRPKAIASPQRDAERLIVATCRDTVFYSWPAVDAAPVPTNYPPATTGDAFHIIGPAQQSLDGSALYETTIDVVAPWGAGKHYWVAQRCVNAG